MVLGEIRSVHQAGGRGNKPVTDATIPRATYDCSRETPATLQAQKAG